MRRSRFKSMWAEMHGRGYFEAHPHYSDWRGADGCRVEDEVTPRDRTLDEIVRSLDFSAPEVRFPGPATAELERAVKRTEPHWLPQLVELPAGGTLLDLGCGHGRSLGWMHRIFDQAIGVDISQRALSLARARLEGAENVRFETCDGAVLPRSVAERSVDLIYCCNLFEHIPRRFTRLYLKDFRRVLKPGGTAVFNLLSGVNQWTRGGAWGSEWRIGYSERAMRRAVRRAGLDLHRTCRWRVDGDPRSSWLWVQARRRR